MNKISIEYLKKIKACKKSTNWFEKHFGTKEYVIEELLEIVKENNIIPDYKDVCFLIIECDFAQIQQLINYFLSLNPRYEYVRWLIEECDFAQTQFMIDYYLSLNPDYTDVNFLITNCKLAQNQEKLNEYWEKIK